MAIYKSISNKIIKIVNINDNIVRVMPGPTVTTYSFLDSDSFHKTNPLIEINDIDIQKLYENKYHI